VALAIAVVVATALALTLTRRVPEDPAYESVLRTVLSQYPMPVSVSPDGTRILSKTRHEEDFEIAVHDRASGTLLRATRSRDTQLSLTWSPDGTTLAFLASRSGNREYRLHLWDLASGTVSRFDAPVTYTAAPPIRWSPRGDALVLFVGGGAAGDLVLVEAQGESKGSVRVLGRGVSRADFRWSPDGKKLAFVSPDNPSGITVADASRHGGAARYLSLPPESLVQDLAWAPAGDALLVTVREAADEFFRLELVRLDTDSVATVARGAFDIQHPYWLPDGRRWVHEALQQGLSEIVLSDLTAGDQRTVSDRTVRNQILGVSASGHEVRAYSSYLDRPPDITTLSLSSGDSTTPSSSGKPGTRPELSEVVTADGLPVPIILWRGSGRRLVIIVHGGPHVQELPIWDARTQALVDEGFSVAAVNYRGSTGYGARFERHEDGHAQAGDVIAVVRHLTTALDVLPERVMLLASSFGALVAADAVRQAPDLFGALVVLATVDIPREYCPETPVRQAVVAFHGQYDPVLAPARARETLARCFGDGVSWRVFDDEGHFFQRSGSWARVYARLVALGRDAASGRD
jgi:dipeptidyl aminopeptidase/acylaminoacyl peptidase